MHKVSAVQYGFGDDLLVVRYYCPCIDFLTVTSYTLKFLRVVTQELIHDEGIDASDAGQTLLSDALLTCCLCMHD